MDVGRVWLVATGGADPVELVEQAIGYNVWIARLLLSRKGESVANCMLLNACMLLFVVVVAVVCCFLLSVVAVVACCCLLLSVVACCC